MSSTIQASLRPSLPDIKYCKDFREERDLYTEFDRIIDLLGLDLEFARMAGGKDCSAKKATKLASGMRILLVKKLEGDLPVRKLSMLLSDRGLLRWFCQLDELGASWAPSKSSISKLSNLLSQEELDRLCDKLLRALGDPLEAKRLGLEQELEMNEIWFDATCLKANIHYPTDWVLLRDATRTLMKGLRLIRDNGILHRMTQTPESFLSEINTKCMEMSQLRGKKNTQKAKKKVLREMVKKVKKAAAHAERHMAKLAETLEKTSFTPGRAEQVRRGMQGVIDQLPEAMRQAESRLLHGKLVPSAEKILSFYEPDIQVIKRGKGNAQVEYGNVLLVVEQRDGLLIHTQLCKENLPDVSLLSDAVEGAKRALGTLPKKACADRGFHSAANEEWLAEQGVESFVAPRGVAAYTERQGQDEFKAMQRRRAQTEARIAIVNKVAFGGKLRSKGFERRQKAVAWARLAHNLWVAARLVIAQQKSAAEKIAA